MNQPLATWNPERDYWETPNTDLFGRSAVYSETLPKSGMTRNGQLYESATWEDATTAPASSSSPHLPTPAASDFKRHEESPADGKRKSPGITAVSVHFPAGQQYLPTPNARDGGGGGAQHPDIRRAGGHQVCLTDAAVAMGEPKCLPTPKASDGIMGRPRTSGRPIEKSTHLTTIVTLLPTPNTMDSLPVREGEAREKQLRRGDMTAPKRRFMGNLREDIVHETQAQESVYGVYEAAVHRWEQVTRPAPLPTEPNSKGKPRLNAAFAEWMMGLPDGWVTSPEIGLSRAQQLKAIGNGVCIPQAVAALTHLLERTA